MAVPSDQRFAVTVGEVDDPVGRLLVLPGRGYTIDHPLLFWACRVAEGAGWQVSSVRWRSIPSFSETGAYVDEAADLLAGTAPPAPATIVLAKSLGTQAAGWADRHGFPGIWLTPLLTVPHVRDALMAARTSRLLIGGTADRLWDSATARRLAELGGEVVEFEGADHALHVGTDWRRSIQVLERTLAAIETFLADNAGHSR